MGLSPGGVTATLNVDTSQFDAGMKKSAETATASGRAREAAAKKAAAAEAFAAKFAGDAISDQTRRIVASRQAEATANRDARLAQKLAEVGYGGEERASNLLAAALQRQIAARLESAAATKLQSAAESQATAHAVSDRMAASAVVRGLESGNVGIRAVENFLTTIPGASKVLQSAFSVIGPLAFAAAVFKGGEEFYEMEKKAAHARDLIGDAFTSIDDKARVNIDDLTLQNDKLQVQIDKIAGKPNNGLAVALDESRKAADALLVSLQADRKELESIFKETKVGAVQGFFVGVASTGGQQAQIVADNRKMEDAARQAGDDFEVSVAAAGGDGKKIEAAGKARDAAVRRSIESTIAAYRTEAARLKAEASQSVTDALAAGEGAGSSPIIDNSAKIENVERAAQMYSRKLQVMAAQQTNEERTAKLGALKAAKEGAGDTNRADELRLKAAEGSLAGQKLLHAMSLKDVYDYWDGMRSAFRTGSEAYNQIVEKQASLAMESAARAHSKIDEFRKRMESQAAADQTEKPRMLLRNDEAMRREAVKGLGEQTQDFVGSNQLAAMKAHNDLLLREAELHEMAGRSITRRAAAMEIAAAHEKAYASQRAALQGSLDARKRQYEADPSKENAEKVTQATEQAGNAEREHAVQAMADRDAVYGRTTSGMVGFADALDEFMRGTKDMAATMRNFTTQTLNGFNSEAIKALTTRDHTKRMDFSNYGAGLARSVTGMGLNKLEGMGLSALGLGGGKAPKGTKSDPLYILSAEAAARSATAAGQAAIHAAAGSDGIAGYYSKWMNGGMGKIAGLAADFLPHFAAGGAIDAGTAAIIGEKGPELFMPSSSGTIIPNHKLGGLGGGDTHHHSWQIDARGSNDPAQVEAHVQRAIRAAAPHIVAASVQAGRERQMRGPASRR